MQRLPLVSNYGFASTITRVDSSAASIAAMIATVNLLFPSPDVKRVTLLQQQAVLMAVCACSARISLLHQSARVNHLLSFP